MATIYRGLNVSKALIDVDNSLAALDNLGLDKADLDLIYGLTDSEIALTTNDIHNVSGLVDDQDKTLQAQRRVASIIVRDLADVGDIRSSLRSNFHINGRLIGGAIKYDYIDFNTSDWQTKNADISTSRISSWSPVGPVGSEDDYILYGGDVENQGEFTSISSLKTTTAPIAKQYRAEVATHVMTMNVNGVAEKFLLMKGIPLTFNGVFKNAILTANVTPLSDSLGTVPMTWKLTNINNPGGPYEREIAPSFTPTGYTFVDNTFSKRRKIEFYYNPDNITYLDMKDIAIDSWTNVVLPNLETLILEGNNIPFIPNFNVLAPALKTINLNRNPLDQASSFLSGGAETSNSQLNSLPDTIESISANGSFTDSGGIDIRTKTALETLNISSQYEGSTYKQLADSGHSPKVVSPRTRFIVDATQPSVVNITTGVITIVGHGLTTGDYVKYDAHVDSTRNLGAGSGTDRALDLVSGSWTEEGSTGTVYRVGTTTTDTFKVTEGIASSTDLDSFSAQPTRTLHSFTKCDVNGTTIFNDSGRGIKNYNVFNQNFTQLDTGVIDSSRLESLNISSVPIRTSADFPHYDDSSAATIGKSNEDRKIGAFRSESLSLFSCSDNTNDVINFSGIPTLRSIAMSNYFVDKRFGIAERTLNGKFDNLESISTMYFYNLRNISGNFKTNGMFKNKPILSSITLRSIYGSRSATAFTGSLRNDIFEGSPSLSEVSIGSSSLIGLTSNDMFGISGEPGHTGQAISNKNDLKKFYFSWLSYGAGRLINDDGADTIEFNLRQCASLERVYINGLQLYGRMLDLTGVDTITHYYVNTGSRKGNTSIIKPGVTYKIDSNPLSSKDLQAWKDMGWVQGGGGTGKADSDVVPWGSTDDHGSNPVVGDYFLAKAVTPNLIRNGQYYMVLKTGANTNWTSVGAGTGGVGTVFRATAAYSDATTGTGELMYYGGKWGVVINIGLSGVVPALDMPALQYFYGYTNSFIGQFPKLVTPRLLSIKFQQNQLTGNIPDLNSAGQVRILNLSENKLTGYVAGSLSSATRLYQLNLNNNLLDASISDILIHDLFLNFQARTRTNFTINLTNQGGPDPLTESAIQNNGTAQLGQDSSYNKLLVMREGGWNILLD